MMRQLVDVSKRFKNKKEYQTFLNSLEKKPEIIDLHKELLFEKYLLDNPRLYFDTTEIQKKQFDQFYKNVTVNEDVCTFGSWAYFPWNNSLFHLLDQYDYFAVRTARNRNLVSKKQQDILYNKKIAVAGLSVGSNALLTLLRYGIGNYFKIADQDTLALTNINRTFYNLSHYGKNKAEMIAQEAVAIDPFVKIELFTKGLSEVLLEDFLSDSDLVIDTFDNFALKIQLRKLAKKKRIPILSGFDIEKGILLIVERYDTESELSFDLFLNNHKEEMLYKKGMTAREKTELFINIIGKEHHSRLMLDSVLRVGSSLTGYPQLIIGSLLLSSVFTFAAENIFLNKHFPSRRAYFAVDDVVKPID